MDMTKTKASMSRSLQAALRAVQAAEERRAELKREIANFYSTYHQRLLRVLYYYLAKGNHTARALDGHFTFDVPNWLQPAQLPAELPDTETVTVDNWFSSPAREALGNLEELERLMEFEIEEERVKAAERARKASLRDKLIESATAAGLTREQLREIKDML